MERAECMRAFLLLVFITGAHLSPDPEIIFGTKGGRAEFGYFTEIDDCVLYRIHEDGDLLLVNCSQPDIPQPDGYNITCSGKMFSSFILNNLTLSQSGDYRAEEWRGTNSRIKTPMYRLIVCAEGDADSDFVITTVTDNSVVLCEFDSTLGNGSSLQLYAYNTPFTENTLLVLDTNSSLEPLQEHFRGRLQVDLNNSALTLSGIEFGDNFLCAVWRGAQCQSVRKQQLASFPKCVSAHDAENVTLPCTFSRDFPEQVHWSTPTGHVSISINQTPPQEVMYMLNGSQSGDYSLIIPSVSQRHTWEYVCETTVRLITIQRIVLWVCIKTSPVNVMFSHGESVLMDAHVNDSLTLLLVQWYRQRGLHPLMLITQSYDSVLSPIIGVSDVRMPEDLMGRVTVSSFSTSVNISNLTAEDSGVYTWRVIMRHTREAVCYEGSFRLVYRDPFGVHSLVYRAPVLGCVLLGLVAAVIWVKLRSRKGEQTSGHQSREGQQSGDEDLYDDVEVAEDSV
ncbi:hypothetical protein ACEWY4_027914 [Coilia grayii]|uniref:Ig-like domain-containing protein n=1 Tax=Coilia grayii TaxID=363190 RepID=A0ABD1IN93_9TELE